MPSERPDRPYKLELLTEHPRSDPPRHSAGGHLLLPPHARTRSAGRFSLSRARNRQRPRFAGGRGIMAADCSCQCSVEQRSLSTRVEIRDHVGGPRQVMRSADRNRKNWERSACETLPVRELVRVGNGRHASQTEVGGRICVRQFDIENERHLDPLTQCAGENTRSALAVSDEILAFRTTHSPASGRN